MPRQPRKVRELANAVAREMMPHDVLAPIGCHCCFVDPVWEVTVFPARTQIVGGPADGAERFSGFTLDALPMLERFDTVTSLNWQSLSAANEDELGPHLSVEGVYRGVPIWLRVLARAPKRFTAGRKAVVYDELFEEIW
jgi:hypothetical protein